MSHLEKPWNIVCRCVTSQQKHSHCVDCGTLVPPQVLLCEDCADIDLEIPPMVDRGYHE